MKKILLGLALLVSVSFADFLRVEAGAGVFDAQISGEARYKGNKDYKIKDDFGLTEKSKRPYLWLNVKHPVPVLPNLRLEHRSFESKGDAKIKIEFGKIEHETNTPVKFSLTQNDVIPYYNLLDNTFWTTLDLGLDLRFFSGEFAMLQKKASLNVFWPSLYTRARVNVPGTGLGAEADIKFLMFGKTNLNDISAKVDYGFDLPLLRIGAELGYRLQNFNLDPDLAKDLKAEMQISGLFFGLFARF
ncbi:MAG: TIGR04219 family outer membrane beta-barrel protein [Helicobacteraceae bacterium]